MLKFCTIWSLFKANVGLFMFEKLYRAMRRWPIALLAAAADFRELKLLFGN